MLANLLQSITKFLDFIDKRGIIRRTVLYSTIFMTYGATKWCQHFADTSSKSGVEIAAIIAAVTAPLTALQGFAFKHYLDSRTEG